jgi:hypothetical protein
VYVLTLKVTFEEEYVICKTFVLHALFYLLLPCYVFSHELLLLQLVGAVAGLAQVVDVLFQFVEKHLSAFDAFLHLKKNILPY